MNPIFLLEAFEVNFNDLFYYFIYNHLIDLVKSKHLSLLFLLHLLILIHLINILRKPATILFLLHISQLRTILQMLLIFRRTNIEPLLIWTLNFILQINAMSRTIFWPFCHLKLALPLLPHNIVLANISFLLFLYLFGWLLGEKVDFVD